MMASRVSIFKVIMATVLAVGMLVVCYLYIVNRNRLTIVSNSMAPTIYRDEVVTTTPVEVADLVVGDIIIYQKILSNGETKPWMHRLIGRPGDQIQVKNGILSINGSQVRRDTVSDLSRPDRDRPQLGKIYVEVLPNGRKHMILEQGDREMGDNTPVFVVPDGHYFVLGDNRDNAIDSRIGSPTGFIPKQNISHRVEEVISPQRRALE